jgi:hypothetical protein
LAAMCSIFPSDRASKEPGVGQVCRRRCIAVRAGSPPRPPVPGLGLASRRRRRARRHSRGRARRRVPSNVRPCLALTPDEVHAGLVAIRKTRRPVLWMRTTGATNSGSRTTVRTYYRFTWSSVKTASCMRSTPPAVTSAASVICSASPSRARCATPRRLILPGSASRSTRVDRPWSVNVG